jgi:parvulin-like peptidyl-prolyl isomerase
LPKKNIESPKHELTKRQLTHRQRETRIQRFTLWGGLVIIIAVLALVGTGVYMNKVKPNQQVVFKVEGKSYDIAYFVDAINYYSQTGQTNFAYFQNYGFDYSQYLGYMIKSFATYIQQNQLIKEAAANLNPPMVVSNDEVKNYISDNKTANNQAVKDIVYSTLLSQKMSDKFNKKLPASVEQRAVLAMFLESQSQVDGVKARIANGETFNSIAETMSLDSTTKSKSGDLGWVAKGVIPTVLSTPDDKTLDNLTFSPDTQINVLTQAADPSKSKTMGYWVIQIVDSKQVPAAAATTTPTPTGTPAATTTTQLKVNVMLLPSQELALDMKAQLAAGADFATLAKANSQYTNAATDGGILDFIEKGKLGGAADTVLFPDDASKIPAVGQITDPIADNAQSTTGGFWLAQVTGIENKTLDGTNRDILTTIDLQAWMNQQLTDISTKVVDLLDQATIDKATAKAVARYNKQ